MSETRREFLAQSAAALAAAPLAAQPNPAPWYRRTYRWGQTNITEKDPVRYDIPWWREYWKRTEVQGVIINAGGIVAYYPSKFPLQHRAEFLGDRDLLRRTRRRRPMTTAWSCWRAWIPTAPPRISSRRIPTGSRATPRASPTATPTSTSPASTALITTNTCPPC